MSIYTGATGYDIYEERFQEIEGRIDIDELNISNIQKDLYFGSYSITSNLNRVIDVSSNIFLNLYVGPNSITCNLLNINSNLYIGDFSVSSNIKYLKNEIQNETQSNPKTAIYRVKQLELVVGDFSSGYGSKNIIDPQTLAIIGNTIYDAFVSIGSTIANLGAIITIWPAIGAVATAAQIAQANAQTANNKADRLLLMWDDSGNNVYFMKSGNLAIGILPKGTVLNNKLEVSGNINITNGNTYKINNVNFGYSNLDHKLIAGTNISIGADYKINNTLTAGNNISIVSGVINNTLTAGTNISIVSGAINNTLTAGTNISIVSGVINNTYTYTLPIAQGSTGTLGGVKVDGTTITINNTTGVISAVLAGSGSDIFLDGGVNNRAYGWVNSTSSLGRVGVDGNYSTGSAVEDIVLRSQGKLILQSGITTPCMVIDTTNNAFFRNNVGIGTSILTINNVLDVGTKLKVSSTAPSDSLTIAGTSGNVGLGITTATNLLHLHKTAINSDLRLQITDGGTGSAAANGLVLGKGTNNRYFLYNYANTDLYFGTNALERLTITAGGNVGIGVTNPPNALLHLHKTTLASEVKLQLTDGTTTSATNTGLAIYKGTDQNGYFWNYQNNDLIFGTNNLQKMVIKADGNVGIANTAPIAPLTIGNSSLANNDGFIVLEKCTTVGSTRQFRIGLNANFDLAMGDYGGNNVAGTWLESFKISYQSPANALVINSSGNIGVNTSNPTSKVHINHSSTSTSPDSGGSIGLYVNNPTNLLNNNSIICNRVAGILCGKVIYSLDVYGAHGWSIYITGVSNVFRINNSYTASGTDVLTIDQAGNATISGSITGTGIISSSFLQGSGAGGAYRIVRPDTWVRLKNTADTDHLDFAAGRLYAHYQLDVVGAATFSAFTIHNAEVRVRMQSVSNTANEYVCIKTAGGTTDGPLGNYYDKILYIAYNTFTGFHRCYVEDELCNDDNIDIFKNDFVGRIVISTGKIKTDASRKKIIENQLEETPDEYEWYSLEDKEGITIEDALPKVQLSRIRKDKRVYGVLGDPNRGTNNNGRIIVNGCGEGAICVCNRNGNIENGDYIQTSDILGYGEKQDDDLLHNYTVAKAVMDCTFELDSPYYQCEELADGTRVAIIACVYKAS